MNRLRIAPHLKNSYFLEQTGTSDRAASSRYMETIHMEFYEVVRKRQSVRRYTSDPIPDASLRRILEAFQRAPSWANRQPWELVLVSDPAMKQRLQSTVPTSNPAHLALVDAPLVVCIIGILGLSGWYKGHAVTGRGDSWFMFDAGIATEHLVLAAAAEGLGTVHVGLFDYEKAGKLLGLPDDRTVVELIPLGYADHEPKRVDRKPLEAFVFTNAYGKYGGMGSS